MKYNSTRSLILCAFFAALTAVCSQISIPLPMVPLNLALLAVFMAGGILGPWLGATSQCVFILLGAIGLPVFSGFRGGVGVLVGPTGGYIAGYVATALITGLFIHKWKGTLSLVLGMVCGLGVCYTLGTAWFMSLTGNNLNAALTTCVFPFLIGDAVKIIAAVLICPRLRRILIIDQR